MNHGVSVTRGPDGAVVWLAGEFDVQAASGLEAIDKSLAVGPGDTVRVDLREVTFIDSQGLNALLRLRAHAIDHGASLVLVDPVPQVVRLLTITKLLEELPIKTNGKQPTPN